jgi:hypothetical protein
VRTASARSESHRGSRRWHTTSTEQQVHTASTRSVEHTASTHTARTQREYTQRGASAHSEYIQRVHTAGTRSVEHTAASTHSEDTQRVHTASTHINCTQITHAPHTAQYPRTGLTSSLSTPSPLSMQVPKYSIKHFVQRRKPTMSFQEPFSARNAQTVTSPLTGDYLSLIIEVITHPAPRTHERGEKNTHHIKNSEICSTIIAHQAPICTQAARNAAPHRNPSGGWVRKKRV